jgi:hypothetical protein
MGIFDKLLGKKNEAEKGTGTLKDGCTLIISGDVQKTAQAFRARGVHDVLTAFSISGINDLTWPEGEVANLTVCVNHRIPIGVINYEKWFGQVFGSAGLNPNGNNLQIRFTYVHAEKSGMILLHWSSVNKLACFSTLEKLEKAIQEWS